MEIKDLLRKPMAQAKGYTPGGTPLPPVPEGIPVCKLNANENQLGPSKRVVATMSEALNEMYLYPLEQVGLTRNALAEYVGVKPNNISLAAGSSSLICAIADLFLNPDDEVLICSPSYVAYSLMPPRYGAKLVELADKDNAADLDALLKNITPKTKLVLIVNPNNPTGGMRTSKEIDEYFAQVPDHVVTIVDEAYFEWVDDPQHESAIKHINDKKVIVLRTFSKIFGLAGLRLGYAVCSPQIQEQLLKLEFNYGPNRLALIGAREAIKDQDYIKASIANNTNGRNFLNKTLKDAGFEVIPSYASFILFKPTCDPQQLLLDLNQRGIILRPFGDYLRISVGRPEQNQQFAAALTDILKK